MRTAYKCRVYPTTEQEALLSRTFGCVRVVWNKALAWRHERYASAGTSTSFAEASRFLTSIKQQPEFSWLNEVSSVALQQTLRNQQSAFTAFFNGVSKYPRFKCRTGRQSAQFSRSAFRKKDGEIWLAKFSEPLKFVWSWPDIDFVELEITSLTISLDPDGRWYVSFSCDSRIDCSLTHNQSAIGIDLGIKDFAVTSDGEKIANPRYLERKQKNLARYQRRMARCQKGSQNKEKARKKVARAHRKIRSARTDFLHKTSTQLVRNHGTLVLEDLHVAGLMKNRCLSKAIGDTGWTTFRQMIQYKANRANRRVITISRWYPSSKTCSNCGHLLDKLSLSIRTWQCPSCRTLHDRDINAAKNILAAGLAVGTGNSSHACGGDVSHVGPTQVQSPAKQEDVRVTAQSLNFGD